MNRQLGIPTGTPFYRTLRTWQQREQQPREEHPKQVPFLEGETLLSYTLSVGNLIDCPLASANITTCSLSPAMSKAPGHGKTRQACC